ncbi:SprT family protein [Streptococcus parauberis]|uniref:SprT family protein n=1 Tax=Streptococcus parauberis TaxID=1348 RepID=UPI00289165F7|nr:SprT family protein [Streptococcus parauberis]MDT2748198.1 SprT family protein [Streptococcus parauberis]
MNLTDYVKQVSKEDFGQSFEHEAHWNNRLKTTGGRFFPNDGHLDFNLNLYEEFGPEIFRKIVRHELCHYYLYMAKKGFRHRDQDFKDLLAQVDGLRYAPISQKLNKIHYICKSCGHHFTRRRQINTRKYVCGFCQGKIVKINQSKD